MRHPRNGAVRSPQRLFLRNNFVCVVKQQAELLEEMSFISFAARLLQFVGHYSDLIDNIVKPRGLSGSLGGGPRNASCHAALECAIPYIPDHGRVIWDARRSY